MAPERGLLALILVQGVAPSSAHAAWEHAHVGLPEWFEVAWHVADRTVNASQRLRQLTGIGRPSLHRLMRLIRGDCLHWVRGKVLSGRVEVDETFLSFNKKMGRASRPAVLVIAERKRGGTILTLEIPNTSARPPWNRLWPGT